MCPLKIPFVRYPERFHPNHCITEESIKGRFHRALFLFIRICRISTRKEKAIAK